MRKPALGSRCWALFTRPESLSSLLPYDEYAEEHGLFCMRDGSLGAVFKVDLLEHEPLTEKEVMAAVKSVKAWFSLPENCTLQVIYEQSAGGLREYVENMSQYF
jgi:hypothetical protein